LGDPEPAELPNKLGFPPLPVPNGGPLVWVIPPNGGGVTVAEPVPARPPAAGWFVPPKDMFPPLPKGALDCPKPPDANLGAVLAEDCAGLPKDGMADGCWKGEGALLLACGVPKGLGLAAPCDVPPAPPLLNAKPGWAAAELLEGGAEPFCAPNENPGLPPAAELLGWAALPDAPKGAPGWAPAVELVVAPAPKAKPGFPSVLDAPKPPPTDAAADGWLAIGAPKGEGVDLARPLAPALVANGEGPPRCVALPKLGGACEA
jgi:hypothetical protein